MKYKSMMLLSGGLDSLVLLANECLNGRPPICVAYSYGQNHSIEMNYAALGAKHYGVELLHYMLPVELFGDNALTNKGTIPKLNRVAGRKSTIVPNRNMIFLSALVGLAANREIKEVLFAPHKGDADMYKDCTKEFVSALNTATNISCGVSIKTPFIDMTKKEIVGLGRKMGVDFDMAYSCYNGEAKACGRCSACIERKKAEAE